MFGTWRDKSSESPTRNIVSLNNRLNTSTYEEDKLEALNELFLLSNDSPEDVYLESGLSLIKSLQHMQNISTHLKIFKNILKSGKRDDLIKLICSDIDNTSLFCARSTQDLRAILDVFDCKEFYIFICKEKSIFSIISSLLNDGCFDIVLNFLKYDKILNDRLVFEGFLEYAIEKLNSASLSGRLGIHYIFSHILSSSIGNQDYFLKNHLFKDFKNIEKQEIELFNIVLNPYSRNYELAQASLYSPLFVKKAIFHKNYEFIFRIIVANNKNFDNFIENFFNFRKILDDAKLNFYAFQILEIILRSVANLPYEELKSCRSYKICVLLHNLGIAYENLEEDLLCDLKNNKIDLDLILFVVFTRDSIADIEHYIPSDGFSDVAISDLSLFLRILHGIDVNLSFYHIKARMIRLRKYICCDETFTLDFIKDMLVTTINDIIKKYDVSPSKKQYVYREFNYKEEPKPFNQLPKTPETPSLKNILIYLKEKKMTNLVMIYNNFDLSFKFVQDLENLEKFVVVLNFLLQGSSKSYKLQFNHNLPQLFCSQKLYLLSFGAEYSYQNLIIRQIL